MDIDILKKDVEVWLDSYFKEKGTFNKRVYEAMEYSLKVGGKRIRPMLLLLVYSMYKKNYKDVLSVACALEMIHTYSLIHDDLPCMDNDDLRRGKPTNHKVYGEAVAVLAGDALLNEAMSIMFDFIKDGNAPAICACNIISKAAGAEGMIGGQIVDILGEGRRISSEELHYMHCKKTGELIKASILAGAVLGEASEEEISTLEVYGEKLGLAFQIKDDVLDIIGDTEVLGKCVNSDVNNDKTTFVSLYGIEKCKKLCITLTEDCMKLLDTLSGDVKLLKELTQFLLKREF